MNMQPWYGELHTTGSQGRVAGMVHYTILMVVLFLCSYLLTTAYSLHAQLSILNLGSIYIQFYLSFHLQMDFNFLTLALHNSYGLRLIYYVTFHASQLTLRAKSDGVKGSYINSSLRTGAQTIICPVNSHTYSMALDRKHHMSQLSINTCMHAQLLFS